MYLNNISCAPVEKKSNYSSFSCTFFIGSCVAMAKVLRHAMSITETICFLDTFSVLCSVVMKQRQWRKKETCVCVYQGPIKIKMKKTTLINRKHEKLVVHFNVFSVYTVLSTQCTLF